ncbi:MULTISPECIES: hypothetical protein [unclassified Mesorhizobium]|uniref:hypothetical protein n=1 Tax=unclassified Mesorhizobium TaxID=325217 RepID=UPI00109259F6|nr:MULTISPECIES: hypothetical protein [unclassified Mesorhizobium]TGV96131.1 hypothetical protein EN788_57775 [Mesorhizobium sp. M2D.F.Ca.ET.145.01.1.1]TIS88688.1 MAG: hypothetical protein E5W88_22905 [Mesorhizobium sp.]TGQ02263.1 hypothetical protein EN861_06150 [Mesorhizobium sp. M8A.F.Ca.ET.218.01.1.1]TGT21535.1 hypothetical protein EN856_06155 [Mesorhizobium sp. M8A.F.Ca.ET.213.01.1.1]TGT83829.1 hypothetical protein EN804_27435 [Mesorhizobium sp. M8A.F.Ca.ET.161.01.1.1]
MLLVVISAGVTFASHMFRLNVALARFCFNFRTVLGISLPMAGGTGTGPGNGRWDHGIAGSQVLPAGRPDSRHKQEQWKG